jgi:hypothetical protein
MNAPPNIKPHQFMMKTILSLIAAVIICASCTNVSLELGSTFSGSLTPVSNETRIIEIAVHRDNTQDLFKTFYQTIPDIKPGPPWIHDIQLNHYDLTSDCLDAHGPSQELQAPYCLVSHGTYQDSWCDPKGWPPGLLPNYRNCLISCNWMPIKNRDWNRIAVEKHGLPQGVSNGYCDNLGPSEMPKEILDEIIARFLKKVEQAKPRSL